MKRWMTGVLGLAVAAVPAVGVARTHYTGRVPASIAMDPLMATTVAQPAVVPVASHKKAVSHKKKATAAAKRKHHKRKHKSTV